MFQRRIHSLQQADGTLPDQNLKGHYPLISRAAAHSMPLSR
jgi:hypothetical protein